MTYRLSNHAKKLRDWIDETYWQRDRASDGWISSNAHKLANPKSDHDPRPSRYAKDTKIVRAIDIDKDLRAGRPDEAHSLAEAIRRDHAKWRVSYIIFDGRITSAKSLWRWRRYTGINPHQHHIHVSFREAKSE